MKNRTVYFEIAAFILIAIISTTYVLRQVGAGDPFTGTFKVTVELPNAAGISKGSEVAYRGTTVGEVTSVAVDSSRDLVVMTLDVDADQEIPNDSIATISQDTAVPVLKVQLASQSDGGPYLGDGAVIPPDRTSIPVPLGTVIANFNTTADTVDPADLQTLSHEFGAGLHGLGPDLQSLVDNFDVLARTVADNQPRVNTLVNNSRSLYDANEHNIQALPEVARTLRQLSDQVRTSDPQIRTLLDRSPSVLDNQILPLIEQSREPFSLLLANSLVSSQIVTARMPAVNALLVALPKGFDALGSIVKDGSAQLDLVTTLGPVCIYNTPRRSVQDTSPTTLDKDQHCTDESGRLQNRGSQNVPTGTGEIDGVTHYDPATGTLPAGDGSSVRMGLNGGQNTVLGENSFAALLVQGTQ